MASIAKYLPAHCKYWKIPENFCVFATNYFFLACYIYTRILIYY